MSANLICSKDREALTKASHTVGFLVDELRSLNCAENSLLAEMGATCLQTPQAFGSALSG